VVARLSCGAVAILSAESELADTISFAPDGYTKIAEMSDNGVPRKEQILVPFRQETSE
jgi:hypothetical protein